MELWRRTWREIQKHLPTKGLELLVDAMVKDDPKLVRGLFYDADAGHTTGGRVTEACAISYPSWKAGCRYVSELDEVRWALQKHLKHYEWVVDKSDPTRGFWIWFDSPTLTRQQVFAQLIPEVQAELARRQEQEIDQVVRKHFADKDDTKQPILCG